jgi:spore maturation protein CgeB
MDFEPGVEFLLADEPKDAAEAVKTLTQNPELAAQIARRAKTAVLERYGEEVQAGKTLELISAILDR